MTRAHEHFCSGCLGAGPNASGWYRCTNAKCTKPALADCPKHSYTDVTALDAAAIAAISTARVTYPVGAPQKRFARDVQSARKLTDKQRAFLWRIAWTYRRQITDEAVLHEAARRRGAQFPATRKAS